MVADVLSGFAHVVGRHMGVTQRCLRLCLAEQSADYRQRVTFVRFTAVLTTASTTGGGGLKMQQFQ